MTKNELHHELLQRFIRDSLAMKRIVKWGYVRQIGGAYPTECDTIASHSHAVTTLSVLIAHQVQQAVAEKAGRILSVTDVALMAAFHDYGEGRSGDTGAASIAVHGVCKLHLFEREGLLASIIGSSFQESGMRLFDDYRAYSTPEALVVHVADNLEGIDKALSCSRGAREVLDSARHALRGNLRIYDERKAVDNSLGTVAAFLVDQVLLPGVRFLEACYGEQLLSEVADQHSGQIGE